MRRLRTVRSPAAEPPSPASSRDAYGAARATPHRDSACNAPRNNLYFSATGEVGPCWIQLGGVERWGPDRSIRDIWEGRALTRMRRELADGRFPGACRRCESDIDAGVRPLAAVYDNERPIGQWPTALELELSNLCNLECVMCNGDLSSKIRRNREHRPALDVPYDDTFVEQVTELLPTLEQVRFSGGEPLLHPIVYKICDRIVEQRPDLRIDVSTNGSTLNAKVRRLLERAVVQINISFESLQPDRCERIRPGADHAVLLANIEEFRRLVEPNGGFVTINTNPMIETWAEMPAFVRFCNERDLPLSFNTVVQPLELSLRSLAPEELERIGAELLAADLGELSSPTARQNAANFGNFVGQVATWRTEADQRAVPVDLRQRSVGAETDAG